MFPSVTSVFAFFRVYPIHRRGNIIAPIVNRIRNNLRSPLSIIRIYFFLWFAGSSFLSPYLPIFYQSRGLSGF